MDSLLPDWGCKVMSYSTFTTPWLSWLCPLSNCKAGESKSSSPPHKLLRLRLFFLSQQQECKQTWTLELSVKLAVPLLSSDESQVCNVSHSSNMDKREAFQAVRVECTATFGASVWSGPLGLLNNNCLILLFISFCISYFLPSLWLGNNPEEANRSKVRVKSPFSALRYFLCPWVSGQQSS